MYIICVCIHIYIYVYILYVYMYTRKSHVSLPNVLAEGYAGCFIRQAVKPTSFTGMTVGELSLLQPPKLEV